MKNKVIISTDCICELPDKLLKKYSIAVMHCYMQIGDARFQDINEINSDSILDYIEQGDLPVSTMSASVDEYANYFGSISDNGCFDVIHISASRNAGQGYANACEAAEKISSVHVVDSEKLSGAIGILVLAAADFAKKGATTEVILQELDTLRDKLSCSFIISPSHAPVVSKLFHTELIRLFEWFSIYPTITIKNNRVKSGGLYIGSKTNCARSYIKKNLCDKDGISDDILFIVTTGCSYKMQQIVIEEAKKYVNWKRIYIERASATSTCRCGTGAIGLYFIQSRQ